MHLRILLLYSLATKISTNRCVLEFSDIPNNPSSPDHRNAVPELTHINRSQVEIENIISSEKRACPSESLTHATFFDSNQMFWNVGAQTHTHTQTHGQTLTPTERALFLLTLPNDEWRKQNKNVERQQQESEKREHVQSGGKLKSWLRVRTKSAEWKCQRGESFFLACLSGRPGFRVCGQLITFECQ